MTVPEPADAGPTYYTPTAPAAAAGTDSGVGLSPKGRRIVYWTATPIGAVSSALAGTGSAATLAHIEIVPPLVLLLSGLVSVLCTSLLGALALSNTPR